MLVAPVDVVERTHIGGQRYLGQQVVGSTPSSSGLASSGQTSAIAGQATGRVGSQVGGGGGGTHWPTHVRPLQAPLASQLQLLSVASQAQAAPGDGGAPVAGSVGVPVPVPPGMHAHSRHACLHSWPVGQSVLAWQPVCGTSGTQMP